MRIKSFSFDLSTFCGTLRPAREMAGAISEEIARGEANPQPHRPYNIPNYRERPRSPRPAAQAHALISWQTKSRGAKKQAISHQMRIRRQIRFVFPAEMCNAWPHFGGIADRINHRAVLLSLATQASDGSAIRHRELLVRTPADCARARFPIDYHTALSDVHGAARRAITQDSARNAASPIPDEFPNNSAKEQNRTNPNRNREKKWKRGSASQRDREETLSRLER